MCTLVKLLIPNKIISSDNYKFCDMIAAELPVMPDGKFTMGMEFSSREAVIKAMKDYTICRGVDYRVHESEPTTFYAKCTQYSAGCDWLIRVSGTRHREFTLFSQLRAADQQVHWVVQVIPYVSRGLSH